jgi:sugar/nucleoside kinase (ribokinase family)
VTLGGENVAWNNRLYFPPKVEAHDVCGAGDTFLASLVFEFLRKNDMECAILFAMKAAAVTVQKIGVYAPTLREIENDKT